MSGSLSSHARVPGTRTSFE